MIGQTHENPWILTHECSRPFQKQLVLTHGCSATRSPCAPIHQRTGLPPTTRKGFRRKVLASEDCASFFLFGGSASHSFDFEFFFEHRPQMSCGVRKPTRSTTHCGEIWRVPDDPQRISENQNGSHQDCHANGGTATYKAARDHQAVSAFRCLEHEPEALRGWGLRNSSSSSSASTEQRLHPLTQPDTGVDNLSQRVCHCSQSRKPLPGPDADG